ncbi:MAG: hypothetical protein ACK5P6_09785 [Pseudobdellovibrionaceae bacterium]
MKLPFHGDLLRAPHKKYQETVVLVHFYGARKSSLKRHIEWLNEIGYDCVFFELLDTPKKVKTFLFSSQLNFGIKNIWTDQIEAILNTIPGKKIIFSFSNPSAAAIAAIVRRGAFDISALICEGGPSGDLWKSFYNYFTYEQPLKFYPLIAGAATLTNILWHPHSNEQLQHAVAQLPQSFPILSIRGWKDPLISPQMIDKVFEKHSHLDWQKLSLPLGGHLNGLKDFPHEYKPAVEQFMKEHATSERQ